MVVRAPYKDNGNSPDEGAVYGFMLRLGVTGMVHTKLTTSDGASNDFFGGGIFISGDTMLFGALVKDGNRGGAPMHFYLQETYRGIKERSLLQEIEISWEITLGLKYPFLVTGP